MSAEEFAIYLRILLADGINCELSVCGRLISLRFANGTERSILII